MTLSRDEVDGSAFAAIADRLADGPDEVHRNQIARLELRKSRARRASPAARPRCYRPTPRRLPSAVGVDRIALLRSERRRKISLLYRQRQQRRAFQRPSAGLTARCARNARSILAYAPREADPASQPPGIGRMPDHIE